MENLTITLIQPDIVWEDIDANLNNYSEILQRISNTDIIVFPEMFTTGFSMHPEELFETMSGKTVSWMKNLASEKDASVVGSIIVNENGNYFNRAIWAFPDGKINFYDKRHLFTMGEENNHYSPGNEKRIVEFRGWKFCPLICYDLRFPVWSRNVEHYDVLIYMANWPAVRQRIWKNLLVARAIENQSYCIGVNRVGTDGAGIDYLGNSVIVSPKGMPDFMNEEEGVKTIEFSYSDLHDFRKRFPVLNDMENFTLS